MKREFVDPNGSDSRIQRAYLRVSCQPLTTLLTIFFRRQTKPSCFQLRKLRIFEPTCCTRLRRRLRRHRHYVTEATAATRGGLRWTVTYGVPPTAGLTWTTGPPVCRLVVGVGPSRWILSGVLPWWGQGGWAWVAWVEGGTGGGIPMQSTQFRSGDGPSMSGFGPRFPHSSFLFKRFVKFNPRLFCPVSRPFRKITS